MQIIGEERPFRMTRLVTTPRDIVKKRRDLGCYRGLRRMAFIPYFHENRISEL
jgi:hypothetical protein